MLKLFRPVLYVNGILSLIMSALMGMVAVYGMIIGDYEQHAFIQSGGVTAGVGIAMIVLFRSRRFMLNSRQLYLLTSCSWVLLSLFGALPLVFSHYHFHIVDAFFESASGITTTGSTVLSGLAQMPPTLLVWRSVLQWLGGLGVIGMAVSILPFLRVGGMRLFQTESSDWSDKSAPRLQDFARSLLLLYLLITTACGLSYWALGMTPFDAFNHAMTTVSTGGYATDDSSMGRFGNGILWASVIFMMIGGLPFTMFIRAFTQRSLKDLFDQQALGFIGAVTVLTLVLAIYLIHGKVFSPFDALTQAAFNITSVITTTGYASGDYTLWGQMSVALFFLITFVGGCSGSTAGGMKIFRFQLSYLFLRDQLRKLIHPRGVSAIRYNGKLVKDDILTSAVAFSFLFFIVLALITLILTAMGLDLVTAFTGTATALANVGPGLGDIIGPAGNFSTLPDGAKWLLAFAMILGRLELLTLMVVFTPSFWRG